MARRNHTQEDVSRDTGVSQSNISRVLSGRRKRISPSALKLCQYAEIAMLASDPVVAARDRLDEVVLRAIGDNPEAAIALANVIESLAPLLRSCRTVQS